MPTRVGTMAATAAQTHTITGADVRVVMEQTAIEIKRLCERFRRLMLEFDAEQDLVDISVFALNDAIEAVCLQVYSDHELLVEFRFAILNGPHDASGPEAGEAPDTPIPNRAHVRLIVYPNPQKTAAYCDSWFERLGWLPVEDLDVAEGSEWQTYGHFGSGGYAVERSFMVSPRLGR